MDQYTTDLLTKWDFTALIETFRDAKIDAIALGLLKQSDIASLIPSIGDRVKFNANWALWKADNVGDSQSSLVSDGSFNGIIYELQGSDQNEVETFNVQLEHIPQPDRDKVETFNVQSEHIPQPDRDKIKSILNNTHRGRALLSSPQAVSGLLDSSQRKELAHLLLDSVLEENPNTQLKWSDFQSWARGIGQLFKKESPVIYYAAYIAGRPFQAKRNASGILYNTYLRKRKNLIRRKVTTPFRKRRATSDSSDLSDVEPARPTCPLIDLSIIDEIESDRVEEASLAITIAVEGATPWNEISKLWAITAKARLQKLYNEKGHSARLFG